MAVAWLFPGQGSQRLGMAEGWIQGWPEAAAVVAEANGVLGMDLGRLMAQGPAAQLDETYNQQPAVLTASLATCRAAEAAGLLPPAAEVAGHSLGEFGALVAAGVLGFAAALGLVRERGRLMGQAGAEAPGRMLAVLGLDDAAVAAACRRHPGAEVANFNAPGQVVVSGAATAVEAVAEELAAAGAKRLVPLPITIAAHSALMAPAAAAFAAALAAVPFAPAAVPVVLNRSAQPEREPEPIRAALAAQLTAPVLWTAAVRGMLERGVDRFYEVGPGGVLTGLVRRIAREAGAEVQAISLAEPPALA
jgi:[acyl-carrier-protein] S-malonyltransferase